jgi:DNA-binding MarR family transcriptional regulator
MAQRKLSQRQSKHVPDAPIDEHHEVEGLERSLIWDVGRVYYAYVGLLERVLVEQQLDHILRPGMGVVLFALYKKDHVSIKELAEYSQLACSTLTGVLQRMEVAGLITRSRDAVDGRLVRVALTKLGRQLESKCREVAHRMTAISEQSIGIGNVESCTQLLRNLASGYRLEEQNLSSSASRKK